jgi:hypothetical protein
MLIGLVLYSGLMGPPPESKPSTNTRLNCLRPMLEDKPTNRLPLIARSALFSFAM